MSEQRIQIRIPARIHAMLASHPYATDTRKGRASGPALAGLRIILEALGETWSDPHAIQAQERTLAAKERQQKRKGRTS
jgi:hypothetical protein